MSGPSPCITLLTDFGTGDGYVGAMKGVLLDRCPTARIIDITHDIAPQDVRAGALALQTAAACFPAGTIHVAVVDPGVGGPRRPLLIESGGSLFLGPDNGLLSLAVSPDHNAFELDRVEHFRDDVSTTFHGRDVFAAVAGSLAAGAEPAAVGSPCAGIVELSLPLADVGADYAIGEVLHVDRFGNLVTNLRRQDLICEADRTVVEIAGRKIQGIVAAYCEVPRGDLLAVFASAGYLDIAVNEGSAAEALGLTDPRGCMVTLRRALSES